MNYSSKIFEMLGVKPNEVFKLEKDEFYYQITKDLNLLWSVYPNEHFSQAVNMSIIPLLTGELTIKKITKFTVTQKEKAAIDYARVCGCNWIAKDENSDIYAYENEPQKQSLKESKVLSYWNANGEIVEINVSISFIKWEDEEPFYIGPEVTFKVVDEYESINTDDTSCVCPFFNILIGTCINMHRCLSNGRKDKCQYSNGEPTHSLTDTQILINTRGENTNDCM